MSSHFRSSNNILTRNVTEILCERLLCQNNVKNQNLAESNRHLV